MSRLRTGYELARSLKNSLPWGEWGTRAMLARQLASGYHEGAIDDANYIRRTFEQHFSVTGLGHRVLEIGPGGNVGVSALYVHHGADEAVCIDAVPWDRGADGRDKSGLYGSVGITGDDLDRVRFIAPAAIESCDLPSESFDVIFSHATMEHISDPDKAVANIARLLKPGGVTSHQIDLRDHRNFDRPLEFLRYSRLLWKLLSCGIWLPPNRLRVSDWERLFSKYGLDVTVGRVSTTEVSEAERRELARPFRDRPLGDLRAIGVHLHATKPGLVPDVSARR